MSLKHPTSFLLSVYKGGQATGEAEWTAQGANDDWQHMSALRLPGFDGRVHLALSDFWQAAIADGSPRFEQQVEGLETIVKLGDTMQLRSRYTVVLEATYA